MPERPPPAPPAECANCGADLPRHAKACPDCGADERTGWRENDATRYDGLDLPDSAFADDDRPGAARPRPPTVNGLAWYWWLVGAGLVVLLAAAAFGLR
jgi:hypothetical protein